jgi:hypothetical protein
MAISKEQGIAVTTCIIALLLIAAFLVSRFGWLFTGHVIFGLAIGLMVGMTKSSIVSGVLPLLFTFAGGSLVALSTGENRTSAQLETLGIQLSGFGIGTIIGVLVGILLSKLQVELPLGKLKD